MATNHIDGDLVGVFISEVLVTPLSSDWKEIVCGMDVGLDGSSDVSTKRTKCGTIKNVGPAAWSITGTGTHNTVPGTDQVSAEKLIALFQNGTEILVKIVHATTASLLYRQGSGQISKYSEKLSTGESAEFDFAIDVSGNLDLTS